MRGQILSATYTGNQGVILGEDGARYTFVPHDWRESSVVATPGMTVAFNGQGPFANDARVVTGAIYDSPTPPQPPAPPQPPLAAFPHVSARRAPRYAGPKKSKTTVALFQFLGAPGSIIMNFYIGGQCAYRGWVAVCCNLFILMVGLILPPLLFGYILLIWLIGLIAGIVTLCQSEEKFDERVHYMRDHKFWAWGWSIKNPKLCLTGECSREAGSGI